MFTNLFEALVDLVENAALVKHLATVPVLVVVGDVVAQLARQLTIDHVLFDLLELYQQARTDDRCHRNEVLYIPVEANRSSVSTRLHRLHDASLPPPKEGDNVVCLSTRLIK